VGDHVAPGLNSPVSMGQDPESMSDFWQVAGCSVRGASHVRANLGNQDQIRCYPPAGVGPVAALIVADGHGSAQSFRSAMGAELAAEVSKEIAGELLSLSATEPLPVVKDMLERYVARTIVERWRETVRADFMRTSFGDAEVRRLASQESAAAVQRVRENPYLAYGTTLVTVVVAGNFMAAWQVGDGDILAVSADGDVDRPVPGDERLIANQTTSLCSEDAARLFRVAFYGTPAPLILVSSDGFSNSFVADDGLRKFASDVLLMLIQDGFGAVAGRIEGWLGQITEAGSGDDISLGVLCRMSGMPRSAAELDLARAGADVTERFWLPQQPGGTPRTRNSAEVTTVGVAAAKAERKGPDG